MPNTIEIIDNKVWVNGNVVIPELSQTEIDGLTAYVSLLVASRIFS